MQKTIKRTALVTNLIGITCMSPTFWGPCPKVCVIKAIQKKKLFPTEASAKKVIFLAIQDASKKWTMPIQNWKLALNRFSIEFEECMTPYL